MEKTFRFGKYLFVGLLALGMNCFIPSTRKSERLWRSLANVLRGRMPRMSFEGELREALFDSQLKQVKLSEEVASGLRPSASPLCARRKAANRHGSEKSIWAFRSRRRRFGRAKRTTNEICFQFFNQSIT